MIGPEWLRNDKEAGEGHGVDRVTDLESIPECEVAIGNGVGGWRVGDLEELVGREAGISKDVLGG